MIKLDCDNYLVEKTLTNYLENKNFFIASENESYFIKMKIRISEKSICLSINEHKNELLTPVDLNLLSSVILKSVVDLNLQISSYDYFPYQRLIKNDEKKILLSDIQNIILNNILLSKEGVDKDFLYKKIWKRDKSIQINKLDTHLTNLKNKLNDELKIKINFQSYDKKLRLLIN